MNHRFCLVLLPPKHVSNYVSQLKNIIGNRYGKHATMNHIPHITIFSPFRHVLHNGELLQLIDKAGEVFSSNRSKFRVKSKLRCHQNSYIYLDVIDSQDRWLQCFHSFIKESMMNLYTKQIQTHNCNVARSNMSKLIGGDKIIDKINDIKLQEKKNYQTTFSPHFTVGSRDTRPFMYEAVNLINSENSMNTLLNNDNAHLLAERGKNKDYLLNGEINDQQNSCEEDLLRRSYFFRPVDVAVLVNDTGKAWELFYKYSI